MDIIVKSLFFVVSVAVAVGVTVVFYKIAGRAASHGRNWWESLLLGLLAVIGAAAYGYIFLTVFVPAISSLGITGIAKAAGIHPLAPAILWSIVSAIGLSLVWAGLQQTPVKTLWPGFIWKLIQIGLYGLWIWLTLQLFSVAQAPWWTLHVLLVGGFIVVSYSFLANWYTTNQKNWLVPMMYIVDVALVSWLFHATLGLKLSGAFMGTGNSMAYIIIMHIVLLLLTTVAGNPAKPLGQRITYYLVITFTFLILVVSAYEALNQATGRFTQEEQVALHEYNRLAQAIAKEERAQALHGTSNLVADASSDLAIGNIEAAKAKLATLREKVDAVASVTAELKAPSHIVKDASTIASLTNGWGDDEIEIPAARSTGWHTILLTPEPQPIYKVMGNGGEFWWDSKKEFYLKLGEKGKVKRMPAGEFSITAIPMADSDNVLYAYATQPITIEWRFKAYGD